MADIPHYSPAALPAQEEEKPGPGMNGRQKLAVVVLDLLVIGELCVAIALANAQPDLFTPVFFKTLLMLLLPTLAAGYWTVRKLGRGSGSGRS